jgi:rod shape-determining protein MreC
VPRNRKAPLAVLDSAERRAAASSALARDRKTIRRRLVVVVLVLLSLMLLTISFRESSNGPLHRLQGYGSEATRPFQVVADRIARPFEDAYGWVNDMRKAKEKNKKLRAELKRLRQQRAQQKNAEAEAKRLESILKYERSPTFPGDYLAVNAEVMTPASGPFEQTIVIAGGENREIRIDDAVINEDGLVGRISQVGPTTSKVTLVSDPGFAASALDLQSKSNAEGIVRHPATGSDVLMLDGVKVEEQVRNGDSIVTSGWRRPDLSSLYPGGISIGRITSYSQNDVNPDKQIQVEPSVDFSSLDAVIVLIPKIRQAGGS